MPPKQLVDLSKIDLNCVLYDSGKIESINPQRYEMRLIDRIVYLNEQTTQVVAVRDVREDEFWVRGHIPGRPLVPGVLMIEAAAQMGGFCAKMVSDPDDDRFFGFAGINDVKFRAQVKPGDQLVMCGKHIDIRSRRFIFAAQGFVNGKMAFEATIIGMSV
ncbi:MAG: beta-hydroxyacyl-ACP dehydratase [Phycisphaerae bacterium]|nr:beta-hydroxyacyl-ACP dehydratase [Phycisphaerae bacterium]